MMPSRRGWVLLLGLALIIGFPLIAHLLDDPFLLTIGTRVLIYGIAVIGLDLLIGYAGLVSFGHAAFFGLGAYTVGILAHHSGEDTALPFLPWEWLGTLDGLVQFPLAMIVAGLFALVIGALSLRTSGVFFIMITLAFAQMLYHFMISLPTYNGEDGLTLMERSRLPGLDLYDDLHFYYLTAGLLILVALFVRRLVLSPFGMVIQAGRQNDNRLISLGIPLTRYRLTAFVISGSLTGLAGALVANQLDFVGPSLMHWTRSGEFMVMAILGGMGSVYGAPLGVAVLLGLEEVFGGFTEHWSLYLGAILLAVVLFARRGIYGWLVGPERSKKTERDHD